MCEGQSVLWHVVLISFHANASGSAMQEVYDRYQTLAEECGGAGEGILHFQVNHNLDQRKGVHLVEIAVFRSNEDLQRFRMHPRHVELTDILKSIADWQVGDSMFSSIKFD